MSSVEVNFSVENEFRSFVMYQEPFSSKNFSILFAHALQITRSDGLIWFLVIKLQRSIECFFFKIVLDTICSYFINHSKWH